MEASNIPGAQLPPHPPREGTRAAPLSGIVVIDFTHFIAGPIATMILADLGAKVIKVEAPGHGDELRNYPPAHPSLAGQSAPFVWANRNKHSIVLDLKNEAACGVVRALIAKADVLVENFSTGVMERLGLGYDACRALNDRLIYCSLSAYGREGSFADRRGFDPVIQAESGFLSMNGYPDRDGVRSASTVMDISAGMMTGNAVMAALIARTASGRGQFVEVSLFDTGMTMAGFGTMQYLYTGNEPGRWGNTSPDTSPTGVFHASDLAFYLSCTTTRLFRKLFTEVVDRPDIAHDPRYGTPAGRLMHRDTLVEALAERFCQQGWAHWQARFREAGVPAGEVRTLKGAIESPEAQERGLFTRVERPQGGSVPNVALPFRFSETPVVAPIPAPMLGEHTASILRDVLGYDDAAIHAFTASADDAVPATGAGETTS